MLKDASRSRLLSLLFGLALTFAAGREAGAQVEQPFGGFGLGVGVGVGVSVDLETIPGEQAGKMTEFTAKFLCGTIKPDPLEPQFPAQPPFVPDPNLLVPGTYLVDIEILNTGKTVDVELNAVITTKLASAFLNPVPTKIKLQTGEARQFDCLDILTVAGLAGPSFELLFGDFFKGWFVVKSNRHKPSKQVNVVAAYTLKNIEVLLSQQPPEPPPPPPKPPEPPEIPTPGS